MGSHVKIVMIQVFLLICSVLFPNFVPGSLNWQEGDCESVSSLFHRTEVMVLTYETQAFSHLECYQDQ